LILNNSKVSDYIIKVGEELKADLIIVGSKGQTFASWMLLGSVAEKLIVKNRNTALLIVKEPGENHGL
jgi:nucleotide-binding universal stress UspA family protein